MSSLNIALRIDAALSGQFDRTFERVNRQVRSLSEMGNQLQRQHLGMGQALQSAGLRNSDNLSRLRDRYREVADMINRVTAAQNNLNRAMRFNENNQRRLSNARSDFTNASVAAGVGLYGAGKVMQAFMEQEDAATDLKIAMMDRNGLVGQFQALNKEVIFLGNQLPGTVTDFFRLAQALKEQGLSDNLLVNGGLRTSAYMNVLMNMDQQSGGEFFAKMMHAHGLKESEMYQAGDLVQRTFFGFGLKKENMYEAMKYAAPTLNSLGLTGLENTKKFLAIEGLASKWGNEGSTFGVDFKDFLERLAMGPKMVAMAKKGMKGEAKHMMEDAGADFQFYGKDGKYLGMDYTVAKIESDVNKIKAKYGDAGVIEVLHGVFGEQGGQLAKTLASFGVKGYQKAQATIDNQADMRQRRDAKIGTLSNAWDAVKGTGVNFLATLGGQFAPELKNLANELNAFISGPMTKFISQHKEGIKTGVQVVASLLGMRLAVAGVRLGFAMLLSPIGKAWVALAKLRGAMTLFSALRLSGIARLPAILQALGMSGAWAARLASAVGRVGKAFLTLGGFIGRSVISALSLVGRLGLMAATGLGRLAVIVGGRLVTALRLMGTALLWGGRALLMLGRSLIFTPIGAALTAIAIAGYLIYKNWDKIAPVLQRVWNALKAGYAWAVNATSQLIAFFASVPSKLATIGGQMIDGLINGIKAKWGALKATISNMANSISSQFKSLMQINSPSKLFMKFGRGIAEGTAIGINNGTSTAVKASDNMANKIANTEYKKAYGKYTVHADSPAKGGHQIHYNPQITVQGNASQEDIKQALQHHQRDFEKMLDKAMASKQRRAYA